MRKKTKYPRVMVKHIRNGYLLGPVMKKGGGTVVQLVIRKGVYYTGVAYCWEGDVYDKRKGKSIAFGRLMVALGFLKLSDWSQTYDWMLSKIGKIDELLFWAAYNGEKIE